MSRPPLGPLVPRGTVLGALLALTVALSALLAYEAHQAARSHQLTAERALRDYAAFAAWELLADAGDVARGAVARGLAPAVEAKAASPYEPLPPPDVVAATADGVLRCERPGDDAARFYFRLDLRTGALATSAAAAGAAGASGAAGTSGAADATLRAWVADTVAADLRARYAPASSSQSLLVGAGRGAGRAVAYAVKYAPYDAPLAAYGLVTCADALGAPLFAPVMARHRLLPASVAGDVPNDSLLAVAVADRGGRVLYRSAPDPAAGSPFAATVALDGTGGLTARAALRPAAAASLLAARAPRSRLPLLLGALALTVALAGLTLVQLRREQALARLRADFASSVSHELRTPLAQILLFGETLSLGRVRTPEEGRVAAETIVKEARRLIHLVENVLHFARAERRIERLALAPAPLAPLLRDALTAFAPVAAASGARLLTSFDESVVATVDPRAVRQIVLNLVDNALKYGPPGQVVSVGAGRSADGRAVLWVDDEGPGVSPADRERVWAPFVRGARGDGSGGSAAGGAREGSGIGLAVVRELAGLMGGSARVGDAPSGRGARFAVELPLAADSAAVVADCADAVDAAGPAPAQPASVAGAAGAA